MDVFLKCSVRVAVRAVVRGIGPAWAGVALSMLAFGGVSARASTLYYTYAEAAGNLNSGSTYFFANQVYNPNGLFATYNGSTGTVGGLAGITGYAYANLSAGSMGIKSTGSLPTNAGTIDQTFAVANIGDTITAYGPTGGLNLGVNLTVNDTADSFSDASQNLTFVAIGAYAPGSFDSASTPLFDEGFVIGSGTYPYSSYFSQQGLTYVGTYGTGTQTIPLNIPFATLGSTFQLAIGIETYENGSATTGSTWDVDYSDTLSVSLVAPGGVTLTSGSGLPGTTAATPEPGSVVLLAIGTLMLAVSRRPAGLH